MEVVRLICFPSSSVDLCSTLGDETLFWPSSYYTQYPIIGGGHVPVPIRCRRLCVQAEIRSSGLDHLSSRACVSQPCTVIWQWNALSQFLIGWQEGGQGGISPAASSGSQSCTGNHWATASVSQVFRAVGVYVVLSNCIPGFHCCHVVLLSQLWGQAVQQFMLGHLSSIFRLDSKKMSW